MKFILPAFAITLTALTATNAHAQSANDQYQSGDLLSLHWDAFPDYDDLQAMIATRELLDDNSGVQTLAVIGTTADSTFAVNVLEGSFEFMASMYSNTVDARRKNWSGTSEQVATQWQTYLEAGATVHVAEGGPSEFTALVVEALQARGVSGLDRIRVVQHSAGANQTNTSAAALNTVRNATTYINIGDGNVSNDTSDFNANDGTAAERNSFRARSLESTYGTQWSMAYTYVEPQTSTRIVDFSDFVEVMDILGVPKSDIPDVTAFANRFFASGDTSTDTGSDTTAPPQTDAPATDDQDDDEASNNADEAETTGSVAVIRDSLAGAREAFTALTGASSVDCDPVGDGRWVCADFQNPGLSDVDVTASDEQGDSSGSTNDEEGLVDEAFTGDVVVEDVVVEPGPDGDVAVVGDNLEKARAAFAAATRSTRVDCDSVGDGRWVCANFDNPDLADVHDDFSTDRYAVVGDNLEAARSRFAAVSTAIQVDCDPVGDGRWVCANFTNPTLSDVTN